MPNIKCSCCDASADVHETVDCSVCAKPFKIGCVDISRAEARKIHLNDGFSWSCKGCVALGSDLNALRKAIVALQGEVSGLRSGLAQQPTYSSLLDVEKIIQEVSERDRRKCNIILFGCREICDSSRGQADSDIDMIQKMSSLVQLDAVDGKITRLGKFDGTKTDLARPLRITLRSEAAVFAALKNFGRARQSEMFNGVSMSRDRTPMQIQLHRGVRMELDERLKKGEKDLSIKYNNGIPKIVSSSLN